MTRPPGQDGYFLLDAPSPKAIELAIVSQCEMVSALAKDLTRLEFMALFTGFLHNPVYRAAVKHLRHVACVVPAGILKAAEVEAGVCLKRDASIKFLDDKPKV